MVVNSNDVAWWISPEGVLISCHGSHTSTVLEDPGAFSLGAKEAEGLFTKGEEDAVIRYIVARNWLRLRFQAGHFFAMGVSLSKNALGLLSSFASAWLAVNDPSEAETPFLFEELSNAPPVPLRSTVGAVAKGCPAWVTVSGPLPWEFIHWTVPQERVAYLNDHYKKSP